MRRAANYTLYSGSGRGVAKVRLDLASVLGVSPEQVRVVCRDMGGNFGTRNFFYPEYALLAWAARRVGRPVKWTCERDEYFSAIIRAAISAVEAELALDAEGNFLAVRGVNLSNLGDQAASFVSLQKGLGLMSERLSHPGRLFPRPRGGDQHDVDDPLPQRRPARGDLCRRAADRPRGRRLGLDPVELRRRNLIPPAAQPYANPLGVTYDSGHYEEAMDIALRSPTGAGFRRAAGGSETARQDARDRRRQLCRDHHRRAARARPKSPCCPKAGSSW